MKRHGVVCERVAERNCELLILYKVGDKRINEHGVLME